MRLGDRPLCRRPLLLLQHVPALRLFARRCNAPGALVEVTWQHAPPIMQHHGAGSRQCWLQVCRLLAFVLQWHYQNVVCCARSPQRLTHSVLHGQFIWQSNSLWSTRDSSVGWEVLKESGVIQPCTRAHRAGCMAASPHQKHSLCSVTMHYAIMQSGALCRHARSCTAVVCAWLQWGAVVVM